MEPWRLWWSIKLTSRMIAEISMDGLIFTLDQGDGRYSLGRQRKCCSIVDGRIGKSFKK
jgi:hypothetical protein